MSEFLQLGEHISIQKGKPPLLIPFHGKGAEIYLSPEYLRNRTVGISAKASSDAVRVSDGATVLLWDGSNAGEFFKAKEGIVASTMARITPDENFYQAFFFHLLKHAERILKNQTNGTGIPHVDKEILENISAFCPSDSQQRKIAEVLDTLDTAIHQTEAIVEKLKQVKQGLLHDLLTRGVDANGELRPSYEQAPELYQDSPLGWVPKAWDVVTLESVSHTVTSGSRDWARFYADSGALFVRIGNLTREHINFRYESTIYVRPPRNADGQRTRLESGDILISITADLGIIGVVPDGMGEAYINQHIALVRPNLSIINPRFVGHYLASPVAQTYISKLNDSGAKAGLNLPTIRSLITAKPIGDEQDVIATRLDEIDKRIQNATTESAKLRELKSGLMDDLLTGRVRVTPLLAQ